MLSNLSKFLPYSLCFFFFLVFGTIFSVSAIHWLPVWIGMEINLIAFIPLMTNQGSTLESESAIKYFIFQALGSALFMLGALLTFGGQFSWNISFSYTSELMQTLLLTGLLIKMGGFPTHFWLPSVASGLTWTSNMILFIWQKIAPIFLMFSVISHASFPPILSFTLLMSAVSGMIGALGGLNQTQIRALLAYSSISHLGWMTFSCTLTKMSLKIYFFSYMLISISIMALSWWMEIKLIKTTSSILLKTNPSLQPLMLLFFLSLGGLPPLLGFIPKWIIMYSSINNINMLTLLTLIISSLISLFYYLSLILATFFPSTTHFTNHFNTLTPSSTKFFSIVTSTFIMMNLFGMIIIFNMVMMKQMYAMGFFYKP
uniref:NADH-ubiquinone oxidoreductase chain 2 n=1 Tax=Coccocrater sp. MNHN-IM-2013-41044 TaxID=2496600 RepID=A0A6B7FLY0_9GAST|nr:NADH dehydrogenase subunit 2 [Coccocrater sp. MNHN-IM-2013-41044]